MLIYRHWEKFCRELNKYGINSVTASSLLDTNRNHKSFLVLKHDVETNPKKALELAKIENKYNHKGSYYVQGYIIDNSENISVLKDIQALGHEVSYHHDVMDSNNGDLKKAKQEFKHYINLFKKNDFKIKTVCQHGNPLVKRKGYTSNRDFFRDSKINKYFDDIYEIMVNYKTNIKMDYEYISDTGYKWRVISDPENNDIIDNSCDDIVIGNLNNVTNYIKDNSKIILSTHPHRWEKNMLRAIFRNVIFKIIKNVAKFLYKVPLFKIIMNKFYYLAKKI